MKIDSRGVPSVSKGIGNAALISTPKSDRLVADPPDMCKSIIHVTLSKQENPGQVNEGAEKESASIATVEGFKVDYSKDLRESLNDLDAEAAAVKEIEAEIDMLEGTVRSLQDVNFGYLSELQRAKSLCVLGKLTVIEALADRVEAAGNIDLAEIAYNRVLDIYREQRLSVDSFIRPLLMKMALFYRKTHQPLRAEKFWLDIARIRHPPGHPQDIEEMAWQSLATSLTKTSKIISDALRSQHHYVLSLLNPETPIPPIHRMIRCVYTFNATQDLFHNNPSSDVDAPGSTHIKAQGGVGSLVEMIQGLPDIDLMTRDILSRSPLFLAASLRQEEAGHALMAQIKSRSLADLHHLVNAKDPSGQSVLGVAILSGCSPSFIKDLIENGAQIDPESLLEGLPTPLQAACMTSNLEIVKLLLEHGAELNRVPQGSNTPAWIAEHVARHDGIVQLINEKFQSSLLPGVPQSTPHYSLGDDTAQATDSYSHLPPDPTISNNSHGEGYNSPTDFLTHYGKPPT